MTHASASPPSFDDEAMRWLPDVMRFALALTRDRAAAEDLVQDTFLLASRSWHQFQAGTDARAWLFAITRHRYYRVNQRTEREVVMEDAELESLASASLTSQQRPGLTEELDRGALRDAIRTAMQALPAVYREVAVLVDWHDQPYETVAQILGVPIGTVRSRLFRARRLLQETLAVHAEDAGMRFRGTVSAEEARA
jgi:RNA polymerase sigma-70 factor (ECF subfamily)